MSAEATDRFTAMYEANYGAIHAYAARRLGSELADEIASETFLVAWRRLDALPSEPLPWLYGIARNMVARHHTASSRRRLTESALSRERAVISPGSEPQETGHAVLWAAWEKLRPSDQEVLALVAWEELAVADAARVLGCPAPVFSLRLHRARRRLEHLLAGVPSQSLPTNELSEA